MKFTLISLAAVLAFAPAALAAIAAAPVSANHNIEKRNLHTQLYCLTETPAQNFQVGPEAAEDNDATDQACAAYRNRNTGTNQWDTCPDCTVSILSGSLIHVCNSAGKHLGGDEMTYYCKQAGATRGAS